MSRRRYSRCWRAVWSIACLLAVCLLTTTPRVCADDTAADDALAIFKKRILPIMQSPKPSSCTECHLSGVELRNYIRPDQAATFAALRDRGLIDVKTPAKSKILEFIARKPEQTSLITEKVRQQELAAFRAWILAAARDPELLSAKTNDESLPTQVPVEIVRHARKDRVLASFIENIWSEVNRCAACHSPDQNQKQVKEFGEQVSWITLRNPRATLDHMLEAGLIDTENPTDSLLLAKPTLQVEHGGGQKLLIGDRTYRQFLRFIEDYASIVGGKYTSADQLPPPATEFSEATQIWLKLAEVPERFDKQLLRVDVYRREPAGWSKTRWATGDRAVFGKGQLWQQHLSITAPRDSDRAEAFRRKPELPTGKYLLKIYVDQKNRLAQETTATLGPDDLVGEVVVKTAWPIGYGKMTVVDFP